MDYLLLFNYLRFCKLFYPPIHPPIGMNSDQKDIIFSRDEGGWSKLSTFLMQGIVVSHFFRQSKFFCTEISDFSTIGKCYNKFPLIWSSSPTQKPNEKYTPHKAGDYTNWHVFRSHNGSSGYICP